MPAKRKTNGDAPPKAAGGKPKGTKTKRVKTEAPDTSLSSSGSAALLVQAAELAGRPVPGAGGGGGPPPGWPPVPEKRETVAELKRKIEWHEAQADKCRAMLRSACLDVVVPWIQSQASPAIIGALTQLHAQAGPVLSSVTDLSYQDSILEEHVRLSFCISPLIRVHFKWTFFGATDQPEEARRQLEIRILIADNQKGKLVHEMDEFQQLPMGEWAMEEQPQEDEDEEVDEGEDDEEKKQEFWTFSLVAFDEDKVPDRGHLEGCQLICQMIMKVLGVDRNALPLDTCWDYLCQIFQAPLVACPNGEYSMFNSQYVSFVQELREE